MFFAGLGDAALEVAAAFDGAGAIRELRVTPRDPDSRAWLRTVVEGAATAKDGGLEAARDPIF